MEHFSWKGDKRVVDAPLRGPNTHKRLKAYRPKANQMESKLLNAIDSKQLAHSGEHLLIRELSHRVNNEFASAIGLVSLAASRSTSEEVKTALSAVANLLHGYAGVHRVLQMPTYSTIIQASDYLRALCQSIKRARLDDRDIELVLTERPFQLRSDKCWKLGMIVSELITNSTRHAFVDCSGTIHVEVCSTGSLVRCCIKDNGSSNGPPIFGEGLKIVDALAGELNGRIEHQFGGAGTVSLLTFPLDQ